MILEENCHYHEEECEWCYLLLLRVMFHTHDSVDVGVFMIDKLFLAIIQESFPYLVFS